MKLLFLTMTSLLMTSCLMSPQPSAPSRQGYDALSDLDNLEMLLLNDQQEIYENKDAVAPTTDQLRLGMQSQRVKRNLGLPTLVEVAGNPALGIERWIYEQSVPTLDGYYKEKKVIYFERGSVVGWESH